ncbi:MAG: hypothetical protein ACK5M3_06675 [Dysgonomonas sp.]
MEFKNIQSKIQLLIIFLSMSLFSIAQTKENDKKLLLGKWELENISIHEANDTTLVNIDKYNILFHREIEIQSKEFVFKYKGLILRKEYKVMGNLMNLDFSAGSFHAEWAIFKNKLYIEWAEDVVDTSNDEDKTLVILLSYKRK